MSQEAVEAIEEQVALESVKERRSFGITHGQL
jgi:hypothetical protein